MTQVVRKSYGRWMGSHASHKTDSKGNTCTLCSKAIGAAGSSLESYCAPWGQETHKFRQSYRKADFGWRWIGVSGWGRVAPQGCPGRTASGRGFPHTSALDEERRWVVMNNVPQMNARRMTLTFPVLNAARRVWILCAGSDKKPVLDRLAAGAALPIGRVRPEGELIWWLARSAAGLPPE